MHSLGRCVNYSDSCALKGKILDFWISVVKYSSVLQGWRIVDNCSLNNFIFTVHSTHNSTNSNQVLTYLGCTLMHKILNDQSAPHLRASCEKPNDCNISYNLRNLETDLALPRPKTNFLKHIFKYSGAMLGNNHSYEAKTAQSLSKFKSKLASLPSAGLHYSPKIPAHQHIS